MLPIGNLADIRTSLGRNIHSLPPTHRSPYLERHILAKKKERLEKEMALLERRCSQCRQHLADLEAQLEALACQEKSPRYAVERKTKESIPGRFTRMDVEY